MKELKNYIDTIRNLPLSDHDQERILAGTAMDLLKLH